MDKTKLKDKIWSDQDFRKELGLNNLYWFSHIYFPHYIKYPTAPFQKDIYQALEMVLSDKGEDFLELLAFRDSAKSTITCLFAPIFSILSGRSSFPIIFSDSSTQSQQHLDNLQYELQYNKMLIKDFGSFKSKDDQWKASDISMSKYGAKVSARGYGQKLRGIRDREDRPDLGIFDDMENMENLNTLEQRNKLEKWILGTAFGALSKEAKTIMSGSLLHRDSIMARLKEQIERGDRDGIVKEYPIARGGKRAQSYDDVMWKGKFESMEEFEKYRKSKRDPTGTPLKTWKREFLLQIVSEQGQIIKDSWIQWIRRVELPAMKVIYIGVDFAVSEKETTNNSESACVAVGKGVDDNYYLLDSRSGYWDYPDMIQNLVRFFYDIEDEYIRPEKMPAEQVQAQKWAIKDLRRRKNLPAKGIKPTKDKTSRLKSVTPFFSEGEVYVVRTKGNNKLVNQLVGWGTEKKKDLVDAMVYAFYYFTSRKKAVIGSKKRG